jgi:hypothetical protein
MGLAIPGSVTNVAGGAFCGSSSLTTITVDPTNAAYASVNGLLFSKDETMLMAYPCGLSGSYTIPSTVTSVGDGAFENGQLTSLTIPNSVTNVGHWAFYGCASLTSVTIGSGVGSIGEGAFLGCARLTAITVDALNSVYASVAGVLFNTSQAALIQCPAGKSGPYTIPDYVTRIGDNAFYNCSGLTAVTIPDAVGSIGDHAFCGCSSLSSARIPDGVFIIGASTFQGCFSLDSVTIGTNVSSVGAYAFSGCASLKNVTLGSAVTNIGDHAFERCTQLTAVYLEGNAPTVGSFVFANIVSPADNELAWDPAIIYYLPGTTGWGSTFGGLPLVLWTPQVVTANASFGVRTNPFGFTINWASGTSVAVDATPGLINPTWTPLLTNTLTGNSFYFSDPQWTNYPARFYRLRCP